MTMSLLLTRSRGRPEKGFFRSRACVTHLHCRSYSYFDFIALGTSNSSMGMVRV